MTRQEMSSTRESKNKQFPLRGVCAPITIFGMQLGLFHALNQSTRLGPPTLTWDSKFSSIYIFICALPASVCDQTVTGLIRGVRDTRATRVKAAESSLRVRFNFLCCLSPYGRNRRGTKSTLSSLSRSALLVHTSCTNVDTIAHTIIMF